MDDCRIVIAKNAGFCFGVQRAASSIENKIKERSAGERVITLGKLIHNETYNSRLANMGVETISENDIDFIINDASADAPVTLFIRAHGVSKETEYKLKLGTINNVNFKYIDCTCPYVKKIHKIAEDNTDVNTSFILMGAEEHPEVVGILSYVHGEKRAFRSADELENAIINNELVDLHKKRLVMAAQTTLDLCEWKKSQQKLKKLYTNPIIFDTICSVTEKRQIEAKELSSVSELMIVIGGKDSSNTAKLYEICKRNCKYYYLVENAEALRRLLPEIKMIISRKKTGIVAGASTPADIIQEVYKTMSEITEIKAENFEEMLESSLKTLNTGDTVTGIITSVTDAELQLDLGAKVTGVITAEQATDDPSAKLTSMFKVGDQIDAFVIRVSDVEGFATLSKKRVDSDKNWQKVIAAKENEEVLEGKVVAVNKGGVEVSVNSNRVFVPASQTGIAKDGDMNALLGTNVRVKIIEIKDQGKRAVASIKSVLRDERKAREKEFWDALEVGMQFTGKVKSMTSYGAFIDLGGVDGMVHTTELSWKHIKSPAEVVAIGDELTVYVKSFDAEKRRISLGYKTEETEPWHVFTSKYAVGDVANAKIVNLMSFGAFAEIVDGVDGLIHISQIAATRIAKPEDVLNIGDVVDAKIIAIDNEKRKVSLSIRALLEEAANEAADEN